MNMKAMTRNIVVALIIVFGLLVTPLAIAATDPLKDACDLPGTSEADACQPKPGDSPISGPTGILMTVTNIVALLAGVTAVIIIIIAGLQFVFSSGDSQKAAGARNAIIYAVVGLVVIIVSRSIIAFVVTEL